MNHSDYLNKTVLIGASWVDDADQVVERRQMYGTIERIGDEGIEIVMRDGEKLILPPYPNALQPAEPGEYTLQETLEIVNDPDYLAVWIFRK